MSSHLSAMARESSTKTRTETASPVIAGREKGDGATAMIVDALESLTLSRSTAAGRTRLFETPPLLSAMIDCHRSLGCLRETSFQPRAPLPDMGASGIYVAPTHLATAPT